MKSGSAGLGRVGAGLAALAALALAVSAASCTSSTTSCPAGQTSCGGVCTDLSTDPNHCGDCNVTCDAGATCNPTGGTPTGVCTCPPPTTSCGIRCVNVQSDPNNCGTCYHQCGQGSCGTGVCTCNTTPATVAFCPPPANPSCVDLATNPANCGACGSACIPGESCVATGTTPVVGTCACLDPKVLCPSVSAPQVCTDLSSDARNCGFCGNACAAGARCVNGACGGACQPGYVLCNGACVDLQTDTSNCGRCGNQCLLGQGCQGGACTACPLQCGGTCCAGGTGCCGTACQSRHRIFPGTADEVSYFNCTAPYVYNLATATVAAEIWAPNGITVATNRACPDFVGPSVCLQRQTGLGTSAACAVFCYAGPLEGAASLTKGSYACPCPVLQQIDWY